MKNNDYSKKDNVGNKKYYLILMIFVILLALLIGAAVWINITNSAEFNLQLGNKYFEEGNWEKAILEFDKTIIKDKENLDAYLGKVKAEIMLNDKEAALESVEHIIKLIPKAEIQYLSDDLQYIVKWWLENVDSSSLDFEEFIKIIQTSIPGIIDSYSWGELLYEAKEPYKEYQLLYINGAVTKCVRYTGNVATVEWKNSGYEELEPYREYEIKYINDQPTDEKRYTGRIKPGFYRYIQYFGMNLDNIKSKFPDVEYTGGKNGAYWYRIKEGCFIGLGYYDSMEMKVGAATVPLKEIYPTVSEFFKDTKIVSKEQFQSYIQQPTEYSYFEGTSELKYSYEDLTIWVICDKNGCVDINNASISFREKTAGE